MQICTTGTVHDDVQQPGEQSDDGDVEQPDHWLSNEQHSGTNESDDEVDDIVDVEDRVVKLFILWAQHNLLIKSLQTGMNLSIPFYSPVVAVHCSRVNPVRLFSLRNK